MKYIDAEKLIAEIERRKEKWLLASRLVRKGKDKAMYAAGKSSAYAEFLSLITSLQQEQPDFPTTDEQVEELLATHPKIEVPEKYKNPDWLFKKQEQPCEDLEVASQRSAVLHYEMSTDSRGRISTHS